MIIGLFSCYSDLDHTMQINLRSTQTNAAFRKLFALPPEEFLIDDFTCHLKRKMPLQVLWFSSCYLSFYLKLNLQVSQFSSGFSCVECSLNLVIDCTIANKCCSFELVDGSFDFCHCLFPIS